MVVFYSMDKILDRYERYCHAEKELMVGDPKSLVRMTLLKET